MARWFQAALSACALIALGGCGGGAGQSDRQEPVHIVHARTPDLFSPGAQNDSARPAAARAALDGLLRWTASGEDVQADALVLVGDFGLLSPAPAAAQQPAAAAAAQPAAPAGAQPQPAQGQPAPQTPTEKPPAAGADTAQGTKPPPASPALTADEQGRAKTLADILSAARPGVPVFFVPAGTSASNKPHAATLKKLQQFVSAVGQQLQAIPGAPTIVDLSRCYTAGDADVSSCIGRLPARKVRLVAYPGFPVSRPPEAELTNELAEWSKRFAAAMAEETGWRTVVVAPLGAPTTQYWPSDVDRAKWMDTANKAVAGIGIASGQPIPRAAYDDDRFWSEPGLEGQWISTPPLLAPAGGPRVAQGASVVSIAADGDVDAAHLWYAPGATAFRRTDRPEVETRDGLVNVRGWYRLGVMSPITRASIFAIALLAAFLTVAAVWRIPAAEAQVTVTATSGGPAGGATQGASSATTSITIPQTLMDKWAPASFLQQNFTRTVLSGLGGLAVASLTLTTIGEQSKSDAQSFYVVWFVLGFLGILFVSSLFRAVTEGLRAGIYTSMPLSKGSASVWLSGMGRFLFTMSDVFLNLIQGKNDLKTALWSDEIRRLHDDLVLTVDRVCEHLHSEILRTLPRTAQTVDADDVRVAVSVLSDDKKRAYYVSWPPKSALREFGPKTVAFVAIVASTPRWWLARYANIPDIVLLKASANVDLPLPKGDLKLADHFEQRGQDYKSFIVIPIPIRSADPGRRAGLHISFKSEKGLETVFPRVITKDAQDQVVDRKPAAMYDEASALFDDPPDIVRLVVQSVAVIQSVLRNFNEAVFETTQIARRRT